jgi:tetratricopeptide (TPR) repeat protein
MTPHRVAMDIRPKVLFDRPLPRRPRISLILLDWSCRESFHIFDYLAQQDVPRDEFEVIWIEYYGLEAPDIARRIRDAEAAGTTPPVDRWIVLDMPPTAYYHKHLMYNLGIIASRGELVMIGDSDAMVTPSFVRKMSEAFDNDPRIVLHLDEIRSHSRQFYPFNYPTFDAVLADNCINWSNGTTTGLLEQYDPLHILNYGACFVAAYGDAVDIGGADEHIDYLGHVCGPYDLTWRLVNFGRREVWHQTEFLYHAWHPGSDGADNYLGPHDGRNVSTLALDTRRTGRVMPLVENVVIRHLREKGALPGGSLQDLLTVAIGERPVTQWAIDEEKRAVSAGRAAWAQHRHADAVAVWEPLRGRMTNDAKFLADLALSTYYVGRHAEALACFDEALALDPVSPDAHRGRAWALLVVDRHVEADDAFCRAIELADVIDRVPLQEAYRGRAWARFHLGKFDAARVDFNAALELTREGDVGSIQDLRRGLGWLLLRQGKPELSAESFAAALEALGDGRGPQYDDAVSGLQQARAALLPPKQVVAKSKPVAPLPDRAPRPAGVEGDEEGGEENGVASPELSPDQVKAIRDSLQSRLQADLAWTYLDRRRFDAAYRLFKDALALDDSNHRAACGFGRTALALGRLGKAKGIFNKLIAEDLTAEPETESLAREGRAGLYYRTGRHEKAVKEFSRALQLARGSRYAAARRRMYYGRSLAYYLTGDTQRAAQDWRDTGSTSRLRYLVAVRTRQLRDLFLPASPTAPSR